MAKRSSKEKVSSSVLPFVIVGCDPGFRNFGIAAIEVRGAEEKLLEAICIESKSFNKKRRIRDADDIIQRLDYTVGKISEFIDKHKPSIISMESLSYVRNLNAMTKIGLVWGACYCLAKQLNIPVLHYLPQELKIEIGLSRSASKEEVLDKMKQRFPDFNGWPKTKKFEHASDAAAAATAALSSDICKTWQQINKKLTGRS